MKKVVIIIPLVILAACLKLTGSFAYKTIDMDAYRVMKHDMQFPESCSVDWIYKVNMLQTEKNIGVVLLKKELVWVDIRKDSVKLNKDSKVVYGNISNLTKGNYKIVIVNEDVIADEMEFEIYEDNNW